MDLPTLWYLIIAFVLAAYVVMDGYDIGIGILTLFTQKDSHEYRQRLIRIIGPHWDGNEVWLIVLGGMLFAVFPPVYASLLSGFYLPFIILLFAFIARGVSIPLRDRYGDTAWLRFWDLCFGLSSLAIAFLLGCLAAILLEGIPISMNGAIKAGLPDLVSPFALLVGVFTSVLLAMHGAIHAARKSAGGLRYFCRKAAIGAWFSTVVPGVAIAVVIVVRSTSGLLDRLVWQLLLAVFLAVLTGYILWAVKNYEFLKASFASSAVVGGLIALFCLHGYPNLLPTARPALNLTIYNACSSNRALITMLILTLVALPVVLAYSVYAHRTLSRSESNS